MLRSTQIAYFKHLSSHALICSAKSLSCNTFPGTVPFDCKESKRKWHCSKLQTADFHTTRSLQVSPLITLTVCTALSFTSVFSGYYTRKWWLKQTLEQQEKCKAWFWERRNKLFGCMGFCSLLLLIFYLTHIERDPILNRRRFIIFNESEQILLGKIIQSGVTMKNAGGIVPNNDRRYSRLVRIIKQLRNANKEVFGDIQWTISIVEAPETNAMVLPTGNVYIFSGIFNVVENDDQLAFTLAHEMSHVLLLHTMEIFSYMLIKEILFAVPTFLIWACFSTWTALLLHFTTTVLHRIFLLFPYKRKLEIEADEVGFRLAAKSCIDVREVIRFWEIMAKYNDLMGLSHLEIPWLMTHPRHQDRAEMLTRLLPEAIELRRQANCPELSSLYPPRHFEKYLKDFMERVSGIRIVF